MDDICEAVIISLPCFFTWNVYTEANILQHIKWSLRH